MYNVIFYRISDIPDQERGVKANLILGDDLTVLIHLRKGHLQSGTSHLTSVLGLTLALSPTAAATTALTSASASASPSTSTRVRGVVWDLLNRFVPFGEPWLKLGDLE